MSPPGKPSVAIRLLSSLAHAVCHHPGWFVWPQFVLAVACVVLTAMQLGFDMDRNSLVGEDKPSHRNFLSFKKEFPGQDDIVVVVEGETTDHERTRQFVERLGARLDAESTARNPTNLFGDVFYKGDLRLMGRKALLFFPETNLVEFSQALEDYKPFMVQFTGATNLATLFRRVNALVRSSGRERNDKTDSFVRSLPAMERLIRMATDSLGRPGNPPSPGVEALFGGGEEAEREKYITFAKGRIYLVSAKPRLVKVTAADVEPRWYESLGGLRPVPSPQRIEDTRFSRQDELNSAAIDRVRALVAEVRAEIPGLNIGVTGEQVLDYDEMLQSQHDSTVSTIVSLVVCALIFIVAYRQTGRPLKATLCLVVGLAYTMGFTTLVVGHLNILTITFVPMLIGLAIDFGVHLVTRYEEELRRGASEHDAVYKAVVFTGQGIFTGCFTTAGAFLAMALTDFKGIREMGIITGGGMLLCLVPMITLLPVLLLKGRRQNQLDEVSGARELRAESLEAFEVGSEAMDQRARLERLWLDRPWMVLGFVAVVSLLALVRWQRVGFDYNLLHMQSEGLPSVVFEHKLVESAEKSVLYGAIMTDSLEEAAAFAARATNLPTVASTESMARFLVEDQQRKLGLVRGVQRTLEGLDFNPVDPNPADLDDLSLRLWAFGGLLGLAEDEVAKTNEKELGANLHSLRESIDGFRAALYRGDTNRNAIQLGAFQRAFLQDVQDTFAAVRSQDASGPLRVQDLPPTLRARFVGVNGKHLVMVYPRSNVWDRVPQVAFVEDLQKLDPKVTGTPVQLMLYTTLLKQSYEEAARWALGAIIVLVFVHFRAVMPVILALLPVAFGATWMVGFMAWSGIDFNPANIMTLPLVIGIGVTNGIHILNRFAEEKQPGILAKSTGKAVLVSGLTTIAGFGSLILADHRGIRSLGWVMAVGTATCMIAALTLLPAILTLRERWQARAAGGATP
ncbi:MAG: MMPL family transporter [Verrucomicrobia bacterium]|nr:MAG: MMPL family transporter [Verrucomicrobiota bacterium]